MMPETYIELVLAFDNDFDVSNITKLTGITPSKCKNRDESRISPLTHEPLEGFWQINSITCSDYEIQPAVDDIISKITPSLSVIRDICEKENGEAIFWVVSNFESDFQPDLQLNKELIAIAYQLNASIRVDLYIE